MLSRLAIVEKAREYLRTPFRHEGRAKGLGVDCVGLIICVAEDLGIRDRAGRPILRGDSLGYPAQPAADLLTQEFSRRFEAIAAARPGDLVTIRFPSIVTHAALVTELAGRLALLHCYSGTVNRVVEHILDARWKRRLAGAFAFPGVD